MSIGHYEPVKHEAWRPGTACESIAMYWDDEIDWYEIEDLIEAAYTADRAIYRMMKS